MNKHRNKQPPKAGQLADHRTDFLNQRIAFKTKQPQLAGRGTDQTTATEG
jgi:hypothetical protein